jgi:hypothetical protein
MIDFYSVSTTMDEDVGSLVWHYETKNEVHEITWEFISTHS